MRTDPPCIEPRCIAYGSSEHQRADLYSPATMNAPVVCLLHGGFWRMPYARDEMADIATDLAGRCYAVWNLEYRRVGASGGGWPGTLQDVDTGIDHLANLHADGVDIDLDRVAVVGHSAGGHLALWTARRARPGRVGRPPSRVRVAAAAGLASVTDLDQAHALSLGRSAVAELLGGPPEAHPDRYQEASPIRWLPLGVPQLLLHGSADEALPIAMTRHYAETARAAGDPVEFVELVGAGHMDFLDPRSKAHAILCDWLERLFMR